jgi:hypothetical protein
MSEQDDKKSEVEDNETEDEAESSPESAPPAKTQPSNRKRAQSAASRKPAAAASAPAASMPASRAGLFVVLALAAGGAAGWFGHIQQARAAHVKADSVATTVSSSGVPSGPCGTWQEKICESGGKASASCQQAKGAAELMMPSTCQAGLEAMPATLARLKAARASCDSLVSKLCADLAPGSSTCEMVKERTPSFPAKRCDEMLKNYDKVIEELRSIEQQGGMQGGPGMPPPGMPPGAPGMPPGAPH